MLTRISCSFLGALLACSLASHAEAGPPKKGAPEPVARDRPLPKANPHPDYRGQPIRSVSRTTVMSQPVSENGRIEAVEDGSIFYSVPLTVTQREEIAKVRGVSLANVPERVQKRARMDARALAPQMVKRRIGEEVSIELRQDHAGHIYATNLSAPKRK